MKKKPNKKYMIIHEFYSKLEKLIANLEKQTGKILEIQINIKK